MKKILLIVFALLLCLSMLACNVDPKPTETNLPVQTTGTAQIDATDATDTTRPTETPAISTGFVEVPKPDTLPTSGWVDDISIVADPYAFTEEGFYHMTNNCLCYTDIATGYTVYLCSKPGCLHGEADSGRERKKCDAFVTGGTVNIMFAYGDSIYYANHDYEGTYSLHARNLDGTGLRDVYLLCSAFVSQENSTQIQSWALAYGKLYYTVNVSSQVRENGYLYIKETMKALVRYDLETGKEEILLCVDDSFLGIVGVNEDMAIVWMSHIPTEEEYNRPDYWEYMQQFPAYLRLWQEGAGGISTLCEMETDATNSTVGITDGKVHLFGGSGTQKYAYDLTTGSFGESDLPADINRIWNKKYAGAINYGSGRIYDLETGDYLPFEYSTVQPPADVDCFSVCIDLFSEYGFVLLEDYTKWSEGSDYGRVQYSYYAYLSFDKLTDGLQLSDRIIFKLHDMRPADDYVTVLQPES